MSKRGLGGRIGGGTALGQRELASGHAGSAREVPRQALRDATAVSKIPQRLPRVVLGPALSTAPRRWPLPPKPEVLPRSWTLAALRRAAALAVRRGIRARALARQGVHRSAKRVRRVDASALKAHFRPLELRARRSSASGTERHVFRPRRAEGTRRGEERRASKSADIDGRCKEARVGGVETFFGGDRGCAEIEIWP